MSNTNEPRRNTTIAVEDEMRTSYLAYAMSVIASRALPDVRDGLKPVQRRILYAMREMGMTPDKQHRKCAGVIGEVLKSFHPHGDSSVYDALVRMAQDFSLRYPLIDGHGNFGSIDPNPPAAYRYTEARLGPSVDGFAGRHRQRYGRFHPQLRRSNRRAGRAAGPLAAAAHQRFERHRGRHGDQHPAAQRRRNLRRDHQADRRSRMPTTMRSSTSSKAPISRPAACCSAAKRSAKPTKPGAVRSPCAAAPRSSKRRGKFRIEITELPYQITIERVMQSIKDAYQEKRITGISDLNDLSNRHGMKIVVDLQRTAVPNVVLNQLYKQTPLQSSFAFNMLALVPVLNRDGSLSTEGNPLEPQVLSLREMLNHFIAHRKVVVTRRTRYDLRKAEERAHLLEGFRIALDNIDEVIKIVRESDTVEIARTSLSARFGLSEIQAAAIVDMRLRTLTGLERQKIEDEYAGLLKTIAELQDILASERRLLGVVRTETEDLKKRLGDPRKTPVEALEGELAIEDIIEDTEVVITVTVGGYIKRVSVDTFRAQNRGGRGVIGIANLKKEDVVQNFFVATTHQHVLFFTNKGRAFRLRAYEIPDSTRQARGTALVNLLTLPPGENVSAIFPVRNFDDRRVSRDGHASKGVIKKTKLDEFANVRRNGLIAIGLDDDDELLGVALSTGDRDIILATHDGMAVHFNEKRRSPDGPPGARRARDVARARRYGRRDGRRRRRTARSAHRHLASVRQTHRHRPVPPHLARR